MTESESRTISVMLDGEILDEANWLGVNINDAAARGISKELRVVREKKDALKLPRQ